MTGQQGAESSRGSQPAGNGVSSDCGPQGDLRALPGRIEGGKSERNWRVCNGYLSASSRWWTTSYRTTIFLSLSGHMPVLDVAMNSLGPRALISLSKVWVPVLCLTTVEKLSQNMQKMQSLELTWPNLNSGCSIYQPHYVGKVSSCFGLSFLSKKQTK